MEKFYFEVINTEKQKISGIISAETLNNAKEKLKSRGFSIFVLVPESQHNLEDTIPRFEFSGKNTEGKPVHGFVNAEDLFKAYESLMVLYSFSLDWIIPEKASEKEKELLKAQGISKEIQQAYASIERATKPQKAKKNTPKKVITPVANNQELQENRKGQALREDIGQIIVDVMAIMKESESFLDKKRKQNIEQQLNLLSRLRQSNALDHLRKLAESVLKSIADEALFLNEKNGKPIESELLLEQREKFQTFSKKFSSKIGKSLATIKIDTKILEKTTHGVKQSFSHFLLEFGDFFGLFSLFSLLGLIFIFIGSFLEIFPSNPNLFEFLFYSEYFWFFLGLTSLSSILYAGVFLLKTFFGQHHARYIIFMFSVICVFLYFGSFSSIFFFIR